MPITGALLADQGKSLEWRARNAELIATLPAKILSEVFQKLSTLLAK